MERDEELKSIEIDEIVGRIRKGRKTTKSRTLTNKKLREKRRELTDDLEHKM